MKVDSSHIADATHDGKHLTVTFKSGAQYTYHDVPTEKWEAFQKAESKGKYLHEQIKPTHPSLLIKAGE
jgi:hypothetical protein